MRASVIEKLKKEGRGSKGENEVNNSIQLEEQEQLYFYKI